MNPNSNNPFGNLGTEGLEQSGDFLGGGGTIDSDVYNGEIKLAFTGQADSGARFVTVHVALENGREYKETVYVTNKQGQNFYEKGGKKNPLPGFTTINDMALLATGFALNQQEVEEKIVKLYDYDQRAEIPQKVQAIVSMMGKPITLGILKQIEDKSKKDDSGNYVPTGETRETNAIDKVFHAETGKTVSEFTAQAPEASFRDKWQEKNKGQVRNRAKGAASTAGAPGKPGAPGQGGAAKPAQGKSLFGG